jgi:hypothetical protein
MKDVSKKIGSVFSRGSGFTSGVGHVGEMSPMVQAATHTPEWTLERVKDYYGKVLNTKNDLKTTACCSAWRRMRRDPRSS